MLRPAKRRQPAGLTGEDRPGATKAISSMLGGSDREMPDVQYPIYSAVTHGTRFALLRSLDPDQTPPEIGRMAAAAVVNADDVVLVLGSAQSAYLLAATAHRRLMGWDDERWTKAVLNTSATIRAAMDAADRRAGRTGIHESKVPR